MKSCWAILLLVVLFQNLATISQAGHHHHGGSGLAHILAAGLIVQLLSSAGKHHGGHHHHHHGHESRHASPYEEEPLPYLSHEYNGVEEQRLQTEASYGRGSWAPRTPLEIGYAHAQFSEPVLESYNHPYFYPSPY